MLDWKTSEDDENIWQPPVPSGEDKPTRKRLRLGLMVALAVVIAAGLFLRQRSLQQVDTTVQATN